MKNRIRTVGVTLALLFAVTSLASCYGATPGEQAVDHARTQLGKPYQYGGDSPEEGFDCSGLTMWAWSKAGKSLPRSAADQYSATRRLYRSELQPGDLIFYGYDGNVQHVAMYQGDGMMIQAQKAGTVVNEQDVDTWWAEAIIGYGRVR